MMRHHLALIAGGAAVWSAMTALPAHAADKPAGAATRPSEIVMSLSVVGVGFRDTLRLRSGAGAEHRELARIPHDAIFRSQIIEKQGEWIKIIWASPHAVEGWINSRFIRFDRAMIGGWGQRAPAIGAEPFLERRQPDASPVRPSEPSRGRRGPGREIDI